MRDTDYAGKRNLQVDSTSISPQLQASSSQAPSRLATAPLCGNTGAPFTSSGGVSCRVDWLEVTVPVGTRPQEVVPYCPEDGWVPLPKGAMGYRSGRACGSIRWYSDGASVDMGCHVVVPGQGCRELEGYGLTDWQGYLCYLIDAGYHITRIDFAWDDRDGLLSVREMRRHLEQHMVTSPYRCWQWVEGAKIGQAAKGGTLYIGSAQSRSKVRIYDKAAEQGENVHWVRVEWQLRDEVAQEVVRRLVVGGLAELAGLLYQYLDFKVTAVDSGNRTRIPTAAWWVRFLEVAKKLKLGLAPSVPTVESMLEWVRRQVAPTLSCLKECVGQTLIDFIVEEGRHKWSVRHRVLIARRFASAAVST